MRKKRRTAGRTWMPAMSVMTMLPILAGQTGYRIVMRETPFIEPYIVAGVQWLRLGVEMVGALIIAVGVIVAVFAFLQAMILRQPANFNRIRISFARYLALALEFQLGADILSTAIAPSWTEIGKLGAIAVIRTALNYFLMREMQQERQQGSTEQPLPSETTISVAPAGSV